ncbi:hypothetical protein [Youngiibacter multivorans]|uniref:ABC-type phosphate transport system auxiliary subunit n=1 Tax=Youngiibacter multivorans TaxID=937251 RepID=A0ABS4G8S2_9CLOT|nr:hypothetical protein [Youngiibacter multivorans]MBP1920963.1 ABC-type phosphate transport system auxiliary subunit [Youngiibacter multivorans]
MDSKYLTIAEAAAAAKLTPQAVYKRIATTESLKKLVKVVDGKKYVHINILEVLAPQQSKQQVDNELQTSLIETIALLRSQLEVKDKQISELNERLREAHIMTAQNQKQLIEPAPGPVEKKAWWKILG